MTAPTVRLATRGSPLARWQANRVAELLGGSGCRTRLVVVETDGDRRVEVPIERLGGQGVFVKEVQAAVARGEAEAAVHSAKDLPATPGDPRLMLAAVPERADPRDLLVGGSLSSLPTGALVATGSARRRAQLAYLRPDLTFTGLRGNLGTRLAAVGTNSIAAVVVAKAAADRLGWRPPEGLEIEVLEPGRVLPQVGQGTLAVECRRDDGPTRSLLAGVDDPSARLPLEAERAYLAALGGGCTLPVGAHAVWADDAAGRTGANTLRLTAVIASADGRIVLRHAASGGDPASLGVEVARYLLDEAGGRDLLDQASPGAVVA